MAKTSGEKASFSLLALANTESLDQESILLIARALEALFVDSKENVGTLLRERITTVLGEPPINKKWFSSFYNMRSRIIHGDAYIHRPSVREHNDNRANDDELRKYEELIEIGTSVLIAILQDLVLADAGSYEFSHEYKRIPFKN